MTRLTGCILVLVTCIGCQKTPAVVGVSEVDATSADTSPLSTSSGTLGSTAAGSTAAEKTAAHDGKDLVFREPVSGEQLTELCRGANLVALEIYQAQFAPRRLAAISQLPRLQRLRLEDLPIDDAAWRDCRVMPAMRILNVPSMEISDIGIRRLVHCMPNLELLRFGSGSVSDEGIAELRNLKSLRFLHLLNVPITDVGLMNFHDMYDLESLYIDGGQETESGIRTLLDKNPKLHFHRNQMHIASDPNDDGH